LKQILEKSYPRVVGFSNNRVHMQRLRGVLQHGGMGSMGAWGGHGGHGSPLFKVNKSTCSLVCPELRKRLDDNVCINHAPLKLFTPNLGKSQNKKVYTN